jgi:hypothetical protein
MDKVVHFELPFDDQKRASKFYSETFGWKLTEVPGMAYVMAYTAKTDANHMVDEKGAINGGLFPREKTVSHPTVVLGVDSVEETVKKVLAAGGKLITPRQAIPNGSYARVTDSEGNIIGLADSRKI